MPSGRPQLRRVDLSKVNNIGIGGGGMQMSGGESGTPPPLPRYKLSNIDMHRNYGNENIYKMGTLFKKYTTIKLVKDFLNYIILNY
jgi:hypothetical protein